MQQFNLNDIEVEEPGFLFVYVSNESKDTSHKIWFNELEVNISEPVLQVDEYYPFGLSIAELSTTRENIVDQSFKYNGGTELMDDFGLNLYETRNRFYSPEVGRFFGIDALSDMMTSMSPMMYSYNNPVNFNDPLGLMGMSGNGEDDDGETYEGRTLSGITITASRIESNTDYSYLLNWRWSRNPIKRATGFEYQTNGLAGVYKQWNTNRTIRRTEGLGYETEFMKGLNRVMGGAVKELLVLQ